MTRQVAILLAVAARTAAAGCLAFAESSGESGCFTSSMQMTWLNPPRSREPVRNRNPYYEPTLADPALASGVLVSGEQRFALRPPGKHVVEIFVVDTQPMPRRHSFLLESGGQLVDSRYRARPLPDRLSPGRPIRFLCLLGVVSGAFTLRTTSQGYGLSAVRWTPLETWETRTVPVLLERLRYWTAHPRFGVGTAGASVRRNYIEQLADRLLLSRKPEIRREALIGLTRSFYWLAAENHQPADIERTRELFLELLKVAPEEPIVRQMISSACLGINAPAERMPQGTFCKQVQPVPWSVDVPAPPPGAPAWAVEQRRLARRLDALTRWWVEKRQQPNGELGGGWGDDVEILRHWGPQALGLGSEPAARGLRILADGLWSSGVLLDGYDRGISDVEHSSEPTTDTVPLRAAAFPDDAEARARLAESAACARNWIARQPDGQWRFRGSWFNCREFDPQPERALDVHLNTRAMGPALWHAYLSRDPALIALIQNWAESWVAAMRSTGHGKPAGIFPPAVRSTDGSYLIGSDAWDKPLAEWDYFQWSGQSQEALASLLLAVHDLTGERRWLEAVEESFQVLDRCDAAEALCKEIVREPVAFYEWRRRSGKPRYDRAFGYRGDADRAAILARMAEQAREMDARLGRNFEMFTSEVIWTDRVYYRWPEQYRQYLFGGEAPRGDRYPTFAVTWPPVKEEFARAVTRAGEAGIELAAYNFEAGAVEVPVRFWRLKPGSYRWESRDGAGRRLAGGEWTIARLPQVVRLPLPPRAEVAITIGRP